MSTEAEVHARRVRRGEELQANLDKLQAEVLQNMALSGEVNQSDRDMLVKFSGWIDARIAVALHLAGLSV